MLDVLRLSPFGYARHALILDADGHPADYRFLDVNDAFSHITGLPAQEIIGKTITEILPEIMQDPFDWIAFYGSIALEGGTRVFEQYSQPLDRWFQIQAWSDEPRTFSVFFTDITELKQKAAELENFFTVNLDLLCIADLEGNFVKVNREWSIVLGYSEEELMNHKFLDFVHPDDLAGTLEAISELSEQKEVLDFVNRYRCKDGSWRYIEWRSHPGGQLIYAAARDITERKAEEEKKLRQAGMIRALLDSIPDIVFFKDCDGVYLGGNPRFVELVGKKSETEIIGKTDYDLFEQSVADLFRFYDGEMLKTLEPRHNEEYVVYPDGRRVYLDTLKTPYRDQDGHLIGVLGISRDITERKAVEEALVAERYRLANIIEGTNVGTWEWNVQTGETIFNERWAEIVGHTLEEISPVSIKTWQRFAHPDDLVRSGDLLKKHFAGELDYYEFESRMRHRDGSWVWVLDRGKVITWTDDKKPLMMMGTHQDITTRKRIEELVTSYSDMQDILIRMSSQFINIPVDTMNEAIQSALQAMGEFVGADRAYVFEYDWPRDESCNTFEWCRSGIEPQIANLQHVPNRDSPVWVSAHRRGETIFIPDVNLHSTDSLLRDFLLKQGICSLISIPMIDGRECVGFIGFDSVSGKHLYTDKERLLLTMFADMLINVLNRAKLEASLRESMRAADEANRAKSEFLANMSHEIRTPMNAVIGLSNVLMETAVSPEQKDLLHKIQNASRILLGIINDILDFSRIEAGKLVVEQACFNLATIVDQLHSLFSTTAVEKGISLNLRMAENTPLLLKGDPLRISQVLINLLGNALKFTERGSVELAVSVLANAQTEGSAQIRFEVADTGIGIPEDKQDMLFLAFSQGDASTTRKYGGTGLGLVISSRLVSAMGGTLQVESVTGKGSRFWFDLVLPVCTDEDKITIDSSWKSLHENEIVIPQLSDYSILLVEDNLLNQEVALRLLSKTGANITLANNGSEAVEYALSSRFDLVLMDIQMPVMDGYEAAVRIHQTRPDLLIVALSAAVMEEDRKKASASGMVSHLAKPLDSSALYRELARLLIAGSERTTVPLDPVSPAASLSAMPVCVPGFDIQGALKASDNDADFLMRLLKIFYEQFDTTWNRLPYAIKSGDSKSGKALAHSLKGVAGTLHADDLARLAVKIDTAYNENSPISGQTIQELEDALDTVRASLDDVLASGSLPGLVQSQGKQLSPVKVLEGLHSLARMLRENRVVDASVYRPVLDALSGRMDASFIAGLAGQLERFEYEVALDSLAFAEEQIQKELP